MPFAAALSEHPLATHATGEVVGQVLDALGPGPDLAVVFVTGAHGGALEDIAGAVRATLSPRTLIGCTAVSVAGNGREVEEQPAVSLWAGRLATAEPVRLALERHPDGMAVTGWPAQLPSGADALILLADPFSFPTDAFLDGLRAQSGADLPVVGGMASAARAPGGNRLVLDDEVHSDGAVGVLVGGVDVTSVVSQGCRPIGEPLVVTRAERNVIYELAGRPALERVQELVQGLGPEEQLLVQQGLHLGRVIDEHRDEFRRGDFLIRNVMGADREVGAVAVGDEVEVGATVQFQVRDAVTADEDLRALLHGREADGALLFTCNGRGLHLFGVADHDAEVVADELDAPATAGMFCAGEIGPVGGQSFVHGFTASLALFRDRGDH
jgi:small ligand-binding sensory domain FIST